MKSLPRYIELEQEFEQKLSRKLSLEEEGFIQWLVLKEREQTSSEKQGPRASRLNPVK